MSAACLYGYDFRAEQQRHAPYAQHGAEQDTRLGDFPSDHRSQQWIDHGRERKDDGDQAGGEIEAAVIGRGEIEREQECAEQHEARVVGYAKPYAMTCEKEPSEHDRARYGEAPHARYFRRNLAQLQVER